MIRTLGKLIQHRIPVILTISTDFNMLPEAKVLYNGNDPEILIYIKEFNARFEEDRATGVRLVFDVVKNFL